MDLSSFFFVFFFFLSGATGGKINVWDRVERGGISNGQSRRDERCERNMYEATGEKTELANDTTMDRRCVE